MSKETFKEFVRNNPRLIKYVKNNEMTWQSFYEIYDMYGDKKEAWANFLAEEKTHNNLDFMKYLKNIDLDNLQESINSVQRVLGVVGDLTGNKVEQTASYEAKPLYQHLDD